MADVYGLLPVGFVAKPATASKADFDAAFAAIFGASVASDSDGGIPASTSLGQEVAILTDSESGAWEREGAIYTAFDSDEAVTPQLQMLCALTGTTQKPALYSSVGEVCFGTSGTVLPAGRVLTVTTTGTRFISQAPATLVLIVATWTTITPYHVGDLIINDSSVWVCSQDGTSSVASPPTGTGYVTDGTVQWYRVCASTVAAALVAFQAEVTGALSAAALALVNIATPIAGWQGAVNAVSATLGQDIESEPALRTRRVLELQNQGGGPANSIRAALLKIPTVEACIVFVNNTNAVNADGVPAHGVEVLILVPTTAPTTNDQLGLAVLNAVGAGTAMSGTTTVTVLDDSGLSELVSFTRPAPVPIYISPTVFYDVTVWPDANVLKAAVKSALGTYVGTMTIGLDVRSSQIAGAIEKGPYAVDTAGNPVVPAPAGSPSIPGIFGVANGAGTDGTLPYIGTGAAPVTSTNIAITLRQIATLDDLSHVVITATPATA